MAIRKVSIAPLLRRITELKEIKETKGKVNYNSLPLGLAIYIKNLNSGEMFIEKGHENDLAEFKKLVEEVVDKNLPDVPSKEKLLENQKWEDKFKLLEIETKKTNFKFGDLNKKLQGLIQTARNYHKQNRLPDYWIDKFNSIGISVNPIDDKVTNFYQSFKQFLLQHKRVPNSVIDKNQFFRYKKYQKIFLKKLGEESETNIELKPFFDIALEESEINRKWRKTYNQIVEFKNKHNKLPNKDTNLSLYSWLITQRRKFLETNNRRSLSEKQISLLNEIGFSLKSERRWITDWDEKFELLKFFVEFHGKYPTYRSPNKFENELYCFCQQQRKEYIKKSRGLQSSLDDEKIEKLKSIKFYYTEVVNRKLNKVYL